VLLSNHVTEVDTHAEPNPPLLGHFRLVIGHSALDLDRTPHRVNDARKFCQEAVAGVLHHAPAMFPDLRLDQLPEVSLEPLVRSFLICPH
jgi:hypothetical protein